MAIELTTANLQTLSGIRATLGTVASYWELLFPNSIIPIDGNGNILISGVTNTSVVDFKYFGRYKTFGLSVLSTKGITTILNANALVNLENSGTAPALTLIDNSLSKAAIDQLFTDLPPTSKTATINVVGNPGTATCDTTIATGKGYTVTTS